MNAGNRVSEANEACSVMRVVRDAVKSIVGDTGPIISPCCNLAISLVRRRGQFRTGSHIGVI